MKDVILFSAALMKHFETTYPNFLGKRIAEEVAVFTFNYLGLHNIEALEEKLNG